MKHSSSAGLQLGQPLVIAPPSRPSAPGRATGVTASQDPGGRLHGRRTVLDGRGRPACPERRAGGRSARGLVLESPPASRDPWGRDWRRSTAGRRSVTEEGDERERLPRGGARCRPARGGRAASRCYLPSAGTGGVGPGTPAGTAPDRSDRRRQGRESSASSAASAAPSSLFEPSTLLRMTRALSTQSLRRLRVSSCSALSAGRVPARAPRSRGAGRSRRASDRRAAPVHDLVVPVPGGDDLLRRPSAPGGPSPRPVLLEALEPLVELPLLDPPLELGRLRARHGDGVVDLPTRLPERLVRRRPGGGLAKASSWGGTSTGRDLDLARQSGRGWDGPPAPGPGPCSRDECRPERHHARFTVGMERSRLPSFRTSPRRPPNRVLPEPTGTSRAR